MFVLRGIGTIELIEECRNICGHARAFQSLKLIARAFLVAYRRYHL